LLLLQLLLLLHFECGNGRSWGLDGNAEVRR
jgi:hypothetical protein